MLTSAGLGVSAGSTVAYAERIKKTKAIVPPNESGMIPVEYKVLVEPIEIEEKTKGGIILPQQTKEQEELQQCKARVVDVGSIAFSDWGNGRNPRPGDMVLMAKYAGTMATGADGKKYRIIQDKEIAAILVAED